MPQDFIQKGDGTAQTPDNLTALQTVAKARGEVMPFEKTVVYATQKTVDMTSIPEINEVGYPMEVHPAMAEKLIATGKATKDKPAGAKSKPKDATEVIAAIGKAKTDDEVVKLIVGDSRADVNDAATARIKELALGKTK